MRCSKCREEIEQVRFVQIITGTYDGTYTIIALGEDGRVYKYRHQHKAWERMTSEIMG